MLTESNTSLLNGSSNFERTLVLCLMSIGKGHLQNSLVNFKTKVIIHQYETRSSFWWSPNSLTHS